MRNRPYPVLKCSRERETVGRSRRSAMYVRYVRQTEIRVFVHTARTRYSSLSLVCRLASHARLFHASRNPRRKRPSFDDASNCKTRRDYDSILPFGPRRISGIQCQPTVILAGYCSSRQLQRLLVAVDSVHLLIVRLHCKLRRLRARSAERRGDPRGGQEQGHYWAARESRGRR